MMNRKLLAIVGVIAAVSTLNSCSSKTQPKVNKSVSRVKKAKTKTLSLNNLTTQEKNSALLIYGALKYRGVWRQAYTKARSHQLSICVRSRQSFPEIGKGTSYIYEVSGDGRESLARYTQTGVTIYFYDKVGEAGQTSLKQILNYLKTHHETAALKKLAVKTKMNALITSEKTGTIGDQGLALVPAKLQGTWYNRKGEKLVITSHTVNHDEIHQIAASGLQANDFNQLEHWARARIENINGLDCYHVQNFNAQDYGTLYSVQRKDGHAAIVTYSVDSGSYRAAYWPSVALARKYQGAKFKELNNL